MEEREFAEAQRNRRLVWICVLALFWELLGRPLVAIFCPGIELPPSLIGEIVHLANIAIGLPL